MANLSADTSQLLKDAEELAKKYDWKGAARGYDEILRTGSHESRESVRIAFLSAECHLQASFQSGDAHSFRAEVETARSIYSRLEKELENADNSVDARTAKARGLYAESILITEGSRRRQLLDEALRVNRTVIEDLESRHGQIPLRVGSFHLILLGSRREVETGEGSEVFLTEGLVLGEKLTSSYYESSQVEEVAEAYGQLLQFVWAASRFLDDWANDLERRIRIMAKAKEIIPRVKSQINLFQLNFGLLLNLAPDRESAEVYSSSAMANARISRNRNDFYCALGVATMWKLFEMLAARDGEQAMLRFREILATVDEAKENISHLSYVDSESVLLHFHSLAVEAHYEFAKHFATDLDHKRRLAVRAVELFREAWPLAELTEVHGGGWLARVAPEALRYLASLEPDGDRRQELLIEAVSSTERAWLFVERRDRIGTPWGIGRQIFQQGMIRYDLARGIGDRRKKEETLRVAVDRFRDGLKKIVSGSNQYGGVHTSLAGYLLNFAEALGDLFELTNDPKLAQEQLHVLDSAAASYSKADRPSRVAEVMWQKSKILSRSGHYDEAVDEFKHSSQMYEKAASSTPSLRGLYGDLAQYMIGWSQVAEARAAHGMGFYQEAGRAYESSVAIFRATKRWAPLGELYLACSKLEKAEAVSFEEDSESAIQLFVQAADGFTASRLSSASWDSQILGEGGRDEVLGWERVAIGRERYCRARVEVEDAKLLYRKGEHGLSARRFAAAKTILEGLAQDEAGEGKKELISLALLCNAWQTMEEAEATSSSARYADAARIFERAADSAISEKIALLAKGHAACCEALKFGTELRSRRNAEFYRQTKESLEVAIEFYIKAGAHRGALWARGTEHLLDGLIYSGQAESDLDITAKSLLYTLSERSFDASAKSFEEANFISKQAQANEYLQVVKQKRQIFASPAEAMDASFVLRSPQAELAPKLTRDQPLGIERFETANIQGNLTTDRTEITVGESVEMLVQLVSAGRSAATLVKLTEIESEGLGVEVLGGKYQLEDGEVNFKGCRVEPFETIDIKIRVTPSRPGEFTFRPSVLYLDERGQYRRYQTKGGTFKTVASLAGEGVPVTGQTTEIQFKNSGTKTIFDCLVSAFVEDYIVRKVFFDQAGWRSLTNLAEVSRIARASLYGKRGRYGPAVDDLLSRGLAEARIFKGQRGRGGEVVRLRISYGKESVRRYVETYAVKPKRQ